MNAKERCFACGRALRESGQRYEVDTRDDQVVWVGPDCYRKVMDAGQLGYLFPGHFRRLFPVDANTSDPRKR